MPQAKTDRQIRTDLHGVLRVPCSCKLSPANLCRVDGGGNRCGLALHKCGQAGKCCGAIPCGGCIIVGLNALEPCSHAHKMFASRDLKIICVSEKVSCDVFKLLRAIAACSRNGADAVEAGRTNGNYSNRLPGHE